MSAQSQDKSDPLADATSTATGACKFKDGSCKVLDPKTCSVNYGSYGGDGSQCGNTATKGGACYTSTGCTVTADSYACAKLSGKYYGDGTSCK